MRMIVYFSKLYTKIIVDMKVSFKIIKGMAKVFVHILTGTYIQVTGMMTNLQEVEFIYIIMESSMRYLNYFSKLKIILFQ